MSDVASWSAIMSAIAHWLPQPWLAAAGVLALVLVPVGALWAMLDARRVSGEVVPLKPTRFALSISVYLFTACWMLGYAQPERISSRFVKGAVWGLLAGAGLELFCIILQAARGRRSHGNVATSFDAAISGTMCVTAVLFIGMVLPLAWEIGRRPRAGAAPIMVYAIVAGLVATFVLGSLTGAGMGRRVAARAVVTDAVRLPIVGTLRGGAPRIAHFLGVHAMQAFPLIALGAQMLSGRAAVGVLVIGAVGYVAVTLSLLTRPTPSADPSAAAIVRPLAVRS